jgi:putative phosphotransacetylase
MEKKLVPVGLSNRHCHLSQADIDVLFGEGYELTKFKDLSQPGQFACEEKIEVVGPKGSYKMRVLGPARKASQIEVSVTDGFTLGIKPPVMGSGSLEGTPGAKLVGPKGEVEIECGVIAAARHIHMTPADAEKLGVEDKQLVNVRFGGERAVVFENVLCRVNKDFALEFHADIDEGNAGGLKNGDVVEIVG